MELLFVEIWKKMSILTKFLFTKDCQIVKLKRSHRNKELKTKIHKILSEFETFSKRIIVKRVNYFHMV